MTKVAERRLRNGRLYGRNSEIVEVRVDTVDDAAETVRVG